jgi:hypothetical protein
LDDLDWLARLLGTPDRAFRTALAACIDALLAADNTGRLNDLTVPTLVIWPMQDNFFLDDPDQRAMERVLTVAPTAHSATYYWEAYGVLPAAEVGRVEVPHRPYRAVERSGLGRSRHQLIHEDWSADAGSRAQRQGTEH